MKQMNKIIAIVCVLLLVLAIVATFSACDTYNKQLVDFTNGYNYAWIDIPGGDTVEGKVQSWTDFEDGDQIQVKIDGVVYLTDTTRCVLASGYLR